MREIKFRAWVQIDKELCLVNDIQFDDFGFIHKIGWFTKKLGRPLFQEVVGHECSYIDLMQYTDLKDKNGKEIYEGDIVKHDGRVYKIAWYTLGLKFTLLTTESTVEANYQSSSGVPIRGGHQPFPLWNKQGQDEYTEVIGNIYENPELLNPISTLDTNKGI